MADVGLGGGVAGAGGAGDIDAVALPLVGDGGGGHAVGVVEGIGGVEGVALCRGGVVDGDAALGEVVDVGHGGGGRTGQRALAGAVAVGIADLHADPGADIGIDQGVGTGGGACDGGAVAQPLVTEVSEAIHVGDAGGVCSEELILGGGAADGRGACRGIVDRRDGNGGGCDGTGVIAWRHVEVTGRMAVGIGHEPETGLCLVVADEIALPDDGGTIVQIERAVLDVGDPELGYLYPVGEGTIDDDGWGQGVLVGDRIHHPGGVSRRLHVDGHSHHVGVQGGIAGPVGEAVAAVEVGIRCIAEGTVRIQGKDPVGDVADQGGGQGVVFRVAVVVQDARRFCIAKLHQGTVHGGVLGRDLFGREYIAGQPHLVDGAIEGARRAGGEIAQHQVLGRIAGGGAGGHAAGGDGGGGLEHAIDVEQGFVCRVTVVIDQGDMLPAVQGHHVLGLPDATITVETVFEAQALRVGVELQGPAVTGFRGGTLVQDTAVASLTPAGRFDPGGEGPAPGKDIVDTGIRPQVDLIVHAVEPLASGDRAPGITGTAVEAVVVIGRGVEQVAVQVVYAAEA